MRVPTMLVLVGACVPAKPNQLAPTQLTNAHAPIEIVRRATSRLVELGFDVTLSDATGGVVQAKRERGGTGNYPDITCAWAHPSAAEKVAVTTFKIALSARTTTDGSAIIMRTDVSAAYPGGVGLAARTSNDDCASVGGVEKELVAAFSAP